MTKIFQGDNYRITVLTRQLVRLEYSPAGYFEDGLTQVVQNRDFPDVAFEVNEDHKKVEIITDAFHIHYKKGPFSPQNLFIDARNNYSAYGNRWYYGETYETLKGTARTLDGANGAIELDEGILSKNGFAVLDDSDSFLLGADGPNVRPEKEIDLYFFAHGRDYLGALKDFYQLTGQTPLLPRYALGNWWSRFWRYSEDEYLELMEHFEKEQVPLAVSVIDMDWHLTEVPERFGSGWTGYTWNHELFPDPKRFLKKLRNKGLATTLNVHPADGIRAFEAAYPQVAKRIGLNQELETPAIFDIADPAFREAYFEDVHHPLEEQGVDFWWIDWQQGIKGKMSEMDPLWLLNYYHYQDISRKGKHDIILSRYAGPGSHRYPVGFSGDTITTWESLAFQPYFTSTASNIGYTWWSHDIGGHIGGSHDEELALRWFQFGVFSPINRLHSAPSPFSGKEPWSYSERTCQGMKKFLHLRHELLPYLYTMNVRTNEDSLPLIQPMYYHYPQVEASYQVPNQYFFGSEFIVAPITEKANATYKTAKTEVWLPEGTWYDFFTGMKYEGDSQLDIYRQVDEIPVFVKAGGLIPLDHQPVLTGTDLPEQIDWHIFPGASNCFELVEDEADLRVVTTLTLDWENRKLTLEISGDQQILPEERQHQLIFHNLQTEEIILGNADQEYNFNEFLPHVEDRNARLFECLNNAEIAYDLKDSIWSQLKDNHNHRQVMKIIQRLEPELRNRIFEIYYTEEN
ncbi:glycoside hydrolase family 31 protein [Enterococcus pallens]|uniref:Uncharacterized protein n=1 Tax=Enterococcus pallens ATCC BAA-351 TaxID=1158607 RepID=R2SY24_9ENTE|nr:glycoside hydrolase family 31 protein [Enterococcus pallens]EOH97681.1 hypothetical protein UAU_00349 [Enterococcus pallens ATCC BAA-351]EOU20900.1 hypothetical protein I588_01747 [Enterococcus pallens ATCC BAA-351]OJG80221.1 hypothetical protein RV10_GL004872 [Enterococcus pallens]